MARKRARRDSGRGGSNKNSRDSSASKLTTEEAWVVTLVIILYLIGLFFLFK